MSRLHIFQITVLVTFVIAVTLVIPASAQECKESVKVEYKDESFTFMLTGNTETCTGLTNPTCYYMININKTGNMEMGGVVAMGDVMGSCKENTTENCPNRCEQPANETNWMTNTCELCCNTGKSPNDCASVLPKYDFAYNPSAAASLFNTGAASFIISLAFLVLAKHLS